MNNSTGKVTDFASSSAVSTSKQRGKDDERRERKLAFTRSLVHGIARLIEGQRQFADEFGLSHSRVFPNSFEALEGQTPTQLAISLFSADWKSITDLENMFQDMITHQVALFSALDGIAKETLNQMGDEGLSYGRSKVNDARSWRLHKERLQELLENDTLRFDSVIAPGFVDNYVKTRERRHKSDRKAKRSKKLKSGKVA